MVFGGCSWTPKTGKRKQKPVLLEAKNVANPPASYRSLSGPPGLKSPKSLKRVSRGLWPRGPQKSGKSLEKVPNRHFRDFFQTFRTFSRLFPDCLGPRGRRPRETFFRLFSDFFETFWGFRARRARETPVARRRVRKKNALNRPEIRTRREPLALSAPTENLPPIARHLLHDPLSHCVFL